MSLIRDMPLLTSIPVLTALTCRAVWVVLF